MTLTAGDLARHQALRIPVELLAAAGVQRVTDREARDVFGLTAASSCRLDGIVYPYRHVVTDQRVTCRLRRDHPEIDSAGKPLKKYLAPNGESRHLFFAPGASALLGDLSTAVVIVEAEKSVLALTAAASRAQRRLLVVGTGGCWCWRGRIGRVVDAGGERVDEKGPLPDFDRITWTDRDVIILFDANAAENMGVQAARRALAQELTGRGARVRIGDVPTEDGINGPDDCVGKHGDPALFSMIDAARPARRSQEVPVAELLDEFGLTEDSIRDVSADVLGGRLRALVEALTGADPLRWALIARELKEKSKLPPALVHAAFKARAGGPDKTMSHTIALTDDEPAPEPVSGAFLLDETAALLRRYVVMTPAAARACALWVGAAYVLDALVLMPMLLVTAATMRAGKTTLLTLLGAIAPRPLLASNLTGAVLARAIAAHHPTLLADEADTWLTDEASELRGIMNAGHTRATAFILRCAPDTHEVQRIPCFGARVLSMIRRPPSTILDRSIVVELRRKLAGERVERMRLDRLPAEQLQLRRRWRRWADDHLDAIRSADPHVSAGLHDRAADNWRPLLAVADLVGGEWPTQARAAAIELSGDSEAESIGVELLADVRSIYADGDAEVIASADIVAALVALADRPWAEWSHGRPLTTAKLARLLRPFGIVPVDIKVDGKTLKRYPRRPALEDAWARYLPEKVQPRNPASVYAGESQEMKA